MAQRAPFPSNTDDFAADNRISYSKESKTWLLEDEQGEEWEWLKGPQKWSKTMDEELMKQQAEAYKVAGVDEDTPAFNPAQKRKEAMLEDPDCNPKNAKAKASAAAAKPKENTAIFVAGLPQDVDSGEVRDYFKRFGMIAESLDETGQKRVKLYNDKQGNFKGEALVIYHRPESVQIAIDMTDGFEFRRREPDAPTTVITVTEADPNFKVHKEDNTAENRPKAKKPPASRALAKKKAEEMNSRLADWSDDEPSTMPQTSSHDDKVVIVKNVFTLEEMKKDSMGLLEDVYKDMMEAGSEHGKVKNVTIFDLEEEGIVTVRFDNAMAAVAFGRANEDRLYDGRRLDTLPATGNEKFLRTRNQEIMLKKLKAREEAEEAKRLADYSDFIEGKGGVDGGASS